MARSKEFEENAVLEKAMKLFWEQGYEKTSMSDLTEHMGIHRRSLYDTFGDKHSLFLKAIDRYADQVGSALAQEIKRAKTATEALEIAFGYVMAREDEIPPGCLLVNSAVELATRDAEVDTRSAGSFAKAEQMLEEILLWGQRDGEFNAEVEAKDLAEYLHNVWVGLRVLARTSASKEKLHRILRVSIQLLKK